MAMLTGAERLIVAADFKPKFEGVEFCERGLGSVRNEVLWLADELHDTGVYLKVNSALRACGYVLINEIHQRGFKVFADLKLVDIPETLSTDALLLKEFAPEMLTVFGAAGTRSIKAVKDLLPDVDVLGITALTHLDNDDAYDLYGNTTSWGATIKLARQAREAGAGVVCAPVEAAAVRENFPGYYTIVTAGVRPAWASVKGDDQNAARVMTPAQAIKAGASRVVLGRPILQALNRREAVIRTIEEISNALEAVA